MFCVALFNFLGLWLIARIGITYALGIAFIAGRFFYDKKVMQKLMPDIKTGQIPK